MNTSQLITHLRSQKAVINIYDGKLKIRVSEKVMTPEIITDIRKHKSEIIDYLKAANQPGKLTYHLTLKTGEKMIVSSESEINDLYEELNKTIYINRIEKLVLH